MNRLRAPLLMLNLLIVPALALVTVLAGGPLAAVEPAIPAAALAADAGGHAAGDLLQPGDLIHVEVYDNPDLTGEVRVPLDGPADFPLVGAVDGLRAMTCGDLAARLRHDLEARFLNHAQVTVTVKEFAPRNVYVMGGVTRPGTIALDPQQSGTAIRALSAAGGLSDDADRRNIAVLRPNAAGGASVLPVVVTAAPGQTADVALQPNDLIMVARLDRVYVTGQVKQPGGVPCDQPGLTLGRALSLAGGFDRYARVNHVLLLRPGQAAQEYDAEAILAGTSADPVLQPGDMVNVPERRY
jgi:polysaccharide export outer membrane protein